MRRFVTGFLSTGLVLGTFGGALGGVAPAWARENVSANTESQQAPVIISEDGSAGVAANQTQGTNFQTQSNVPCTCAQAAGTASQQELTGTSVAHQTLISPQTLSNEVIGFLPNAGAMVFHDSTGSETTRAVYGLTADWDFSPMVTDNPDLYVGLSTGGLFSHLGSATSDFWGTNPDAVVNSPGANMLLIPADLKLGLNLTDDFRISVRGGGNVIYRSEGLAMDLGPSTSTANSVWRIYPNFGGDVEFGLTRGVVLGLRPDYTITPGGNIFVGTLALGVAIG